MSKQSAVELLSFDFNDVKQVYHRPSVAKTLEEFGSKLEGKSLEF